MAGEVIHYNDSGWTQTISMIVAPVVPLFDVTKLNHFMHGLVQEVPISSKDEATSRGDGGIHLGRLYFDEPIGRRKIETTTFVTTLEIEELQKAGISIGESHNTQIEEIMRRTWVRVYPDKLSAKTIFDYEQGLLHGTVEPNSTFNYLEHWIEGEQIRILKKEGQNPFARIVNKLSGKTK